MSAQAGNRDQRRGLDQRRTSHASAARPNLLPARLSELGMLAPDQNYLRLSITYQSGMADDQGWCEV